MFSLVRSVAKTAALLWVCGWLLAGCAKEAPIAPSCGTMDVPAKATDPRGGDDSSVNGEDPGISDDGDDMGDSSGRQRPKGN